MLRYKEIGTVLSHEQLNEPRTSNVVWHVLSQPQLAGFALHALKRKGEENTNSE